MQSPRRFGPARILVVLWLSLTIAGAASAQTADQAAEAALAKRWAEIFAEVQKARGAALDAAALTLVAPPGMTKEAIYGEMVERLLADAMLRALFDQPATYRRLIDETARQVAESKKAASLNGAATNPASGSFLERSGFTDFLALMIDTRSLFSADDSAVSINLNALALLKAGNAQVYSQPRIYQQMGGLRRVGGTFTFGAKVPKGEISGFTGFPDASKLLDAVTWDVKVRVVGDRDPRATRWFPLLLGEAGARTQIAALATTLRPTPLADAVTLAQVFERTLGEVVERAKREIDNSLQVSIKASGQHLTTETGMNRYFVGALADKGLGPTDLTVNVAFASAQNPGMTGGDPFRLKDWTVAFGLTGTMWQNALISGRGSEISVSGEGKFPIDETGVPIRRKNIWKTSASLTLPFGDSAKIPVSVIWTNDPNNLTKEKFVTGHVGVSYDFGALKALFKPKA